MTEELIKVIRDLKALIRGAKEDNSIFTEQKQAATEQELTELEISQIEDEQMLTDHDIAIMELQAAAE